MAREFPCCRAHSSVCRRRRCGVVGGRHVPSSVGNWTRRRWQRGRWTVCCSRTLSRCALIVDLDRARAERATLRWLQRFIEMLDVRTSSVAVIASRLQADGAFTVTKFRKRRCGERDLGEWRRPLILHAVDKVGARLTSQTAYDVLNWPCIRSRPKARKPPTRSCARGEEPKATEFDCGASSY